MRLQETTPQDDKTYRLVMAISPGDDLSALYASIGGIIQKIDITPFQMRGITGQAQQITLFLSIANDEELNNIQHQLTASGIRVLELSRVI
jgi:hypothetical protein